MRFLLFAVALFLLNGISAQRLSIPEGTNKRAIKYYEKGKEALHERRPDEAAILFTKAIEKDTSFLAARIMRASLSFQLKDYAAAESDLNKVINSGQEFHPKVYYTIAVSQRALDKFSEATSNFKTFLSFEGQAENLVEKARSYYLECAFSAEAIKNPHRFKPQAFGPAINTDANEYLPSMTADGKTMIFTRRVGAHEYLFESHLVNGEWSQAESIEAINGVMESGAHSISADGKLLVFTSCERLDGYGSCDLYYSKRKNGSWTPPRNLGSHINSAAWDSQPCLADNGRTIYFASNRKGTIGKKDLWVTRRGPDQRWSKPRNLGRDINTEGNEQSPFIHFDGGTLYFTSNAHVGMGDYDIYKINRVNDTTWTGMTNLGYPINTKYHDGTLSVSLSGEKGFITSDRHHRIDLDKDHLTKAETDIFYFDMPIDLRPQASTFLAINVVDKATKEPILARVKVLESTPEGTIHEFLTDEEGQTLVVLPLKKDYAIQVDKEGYTFYSERVELQEVHTLEDPLELTVELWKPEDTKEDPIVLKNILFATGSDQLLDASKYEIDRLFDLLTEKPSIFIEIRGHTDDVGSDIDNQSLSQARAKRVHDELVNKGIDAERLSYIGFGESRPIADNTTVEGRQLNRRTEFVILKK